MPRDIMLRLRPEVAEALDARARKLGLPGAGLAHRLIGQGLGLSHELAEPRTVGRPPKPKPAR